MIDYGRCRSYCSRYDRRALERGQRPRRASGRTLGVRGFGGRTRHVLPSPEAEDRASAAPAAPAEPWAKRNGRRFSRCCVRRVCGPRSRGSLRDTARRRRLPVLGADDVPRPGREPGGPGAPAQRSHLNHPKPDHPGFPSRFATASPSGVDPGPFGTEHTESTDSDHRRHHSGEGTRVPATRQNEARNRRPERALPAQESTP